MKNMYRYVLLYAALNAAAFAQMILPTTVSGKFSAPQWQYNYPSETRLDNPDFPNGFSLTFSFTVNVPQQGHFTGSVNTLDQLNPEPLTIGATNLTRNDIGASSVFNDGQLSYFWIGGLVDGIGGVFDNWVAGYPSDFFLLYAPENNLSFLLYQVNGHFAQVRGINFDAWVSTSTAQPVPEASTVGPCAGALLSGLVILRKCWRKKKISAST